MKPRLHRQRRRWIRALPWAGVLAAAIVVWMVRLDHAERHDERRPSSAAPAATPESPSPTPNPAANATTSHAATRNFAGALLTASNSSVDTAVTIPPNANLPPARRVRVAQIDPAWLDRKRSPLFDPRAVGTLVPLPLWDDCDLMVRLQGSEVLGQDRHLVRGEVEGVPGSRFLLTITGDAVAFSVYLDPEERHGAIPLGGGRVALYELDPTTGPGCAGPLPALADSNALAEAVARPLAMRTGSVSAEGGADGEPPTAATVPTATAQIDMLVHYTSEVSSNAQPEPAVVSRVDLAIAEANDEYSRSETRVELRLVGLRQTIYTETGSNSTTLDRLRITNDGFMDEIHAARDQLGADVVCLLVQRSDPGNIGIAYILDSLADPDRSFNDLFAFSVVQYAWATTSSTFTHELGHNLGCAHDRENSSSTGVFSYSYGHRLVGADNRTYRTIMAYQPGTAVPYFSNPRIVHPVAQRSLGVATGLSGEADNAQSVNRAAYSVASYRSNRQDPPARGRLHNVSTRAWVGTGDDVLIGGFFIGSPGPKQVFVRVRGPALAQFDVPDVLLDPQVELVNQSTAQTIAVNGNWGSAPNSAAISASGLAPTDAREPAMLVSLDPGGYTVIARGENSTTGIALIEVFEIDGNSIPKLINLSTRGFVGVGDRVMIGGVVVNGQPGETKRLLFRALGPSLADFDVANPLHDPALRLYNQSSEELIDNDDWDYLSDTLQAQVQAVGLAPSVRRESVLLVDLPPGQYTLIVRPFENETGAEPGVGLVEAYEIITP